MTITVRIQYKGEAARKLAAEEGKEIPADPPRYTEQMERALSHFSIPPPHNSRAIWKSGFILCNWNITRESSLFDIIFRGATRAQSVACKGTLENLSISFIHLFENNKPIWLNYKGRNNSTNPLTVESSSDTLVDEPVLFERKPYTPYKNHKYGPRSAGPETSFSNNSLLSRTSTAATLPVSDSYDKSMSRRSSVQGGANTMSYTERSHTASGAVQPATPNTAPDTQDTLRKLAGSQTLLALLGQGPANSDQAPSMKGEVMSPTSLQERPPSAPRVMHHSHSRGRSIDDSAFPAGNLSNLDRSISRPASFQDNLDRPPRKWPPKDDRSYQRFNRFDRNDARDSFTNGFQKFPQQRRSASPVSRNLSFDTGNDAFRQRPKIDRDRWERKPNDFYARVEQLDQVDNVPRRHTYNGDTTAIPDQPWSTGTKRSLSPGSARHDHPFTPHVKRHHPVSSVAAEAAAARRPISYKKPYNPAMMTRRSASPVASKSWVFNARSDFLEQPNTRDPEPVAPMVVNETPNGLTPRPERINALNRELWDVRRQLTALKAREDSIAHELGALRAPVPADPAEKATTDGLSPEERIKAMELEMNSLRERLEREKERRLLVEEACENERKRRKLAEDILDDARRETSAPMVLPAMMDAFEKIAQLTGDALDKDEG